MTSNVSFLTNCKENFKRRTWVTLLMGLFFFIAYIITPVILISQVDPIQDNLKISINNFHKLFSLNMTVGVFIAMIAVLFALQGYSYLYNRTKMDLYMSVPISTKKRFHIIQFTSILTFIFFYLVTGCLGLLIGTTGGFTSILCVRDFFFAFLINLLLFISIYELACIAVMMTGHVIVSVLAFIVFSCYEFFARLLHSAYIVSFMSHLLPPNIEEVISSPFYPYSKLVNSLTHTNINSKLFDSFNMNSILWLITFCVVFYLIAYILYRKRPTEATDCALSFPKTKPWISIFIQILAALGSGLFFYSISWEKTGMAIFGILLGSFLVFCTINIIYEFDIKAIFKKRYTYILSISIALIYFLSISYDLFDIDSYVPEVSKIESCGIESYNLPQIGYWEDNDSYSFWSDSETICNEMHITNAEPFIEIANAALERELTNEIVSGDDYISYTLCFHLKTGKKVYRRYNISLDRIQPQLTEIFESKDNINAVKNRINLYNSNHTNTELYFSNGFYEIHLSSDNKNELLETYFKDLSQFSYMENVLSAPLSEWVLKSTSDDSLYLPIYSNFTSSLALLEKYNLTNDMTLNANEVSEIQIYLFPVKQEMQVDENMIDDELRMKSSINTNYSSSVINPKEIEALLQNISLSRYSSPINNPTNISLYNSEEYYVEISIFPKVGTQHETEISSNYFNFQGDIPSFLTFRK